MEKYSLKIKGRTAQLFWATVNELKTAAFMQSQKNNTCESRQLI